MLQKVVDIAKMPLDPSDTIRGYLSRVADWYQVPLGNLGNLLEKASFGTGLSKAEEQEFQTILDSLREAAARKGPPGLSEEAEIGQAETPLVQDETPVAESREHQPHSGEEARRHQVQEVYHQPATGMPSLPDLTVGFSRVWGTLASAPSRLARWPYQVTTWPERIRTQGGSILAWRPTAGQLITLASLLFLYGVSLALHLPNRPTSFWEPDAARLFSELVGRFPTGLDSFSNPAISPSGMLRHAHGVTQFVPGLLLIPVVELFRLPLTDDLLSTYYIVITSAIVVPLYLLVRLVSGSGLVATVGVFISLFMRADLRMLRIGGLTHVAFELALSAVVLCAFYKYGQAPTRKWAWMAGLALAALCLTGITFPFLLPALVFAMVSAKEGSFVQRCRAVAKDAVRPGLLVLPMLAIGLHAWVFLVPSPMQDGGVFAHVLTRGGEFPLAFRMGYLWDLLQTQAPGVLPMAILVVSVPGLWYAVRLHPSGILFIWGWTNLALVVLKFPRHVTETWNLFGVLPLVFLVFVMSWILSRALVVRFGWRPGVAAIPIAVLCLVIALPFLTGQQRIGFWPTYKSGEAGTKASAAYVRTLPNQGGGVVVWGLEPFPTLFYFTRGTAMPPLRPAPLLEVSECLRKIEPLADTLVFFDLGLERWYPKAEPGDFHRPGPPFQVVAIVEDDAGTHFASIYRKADKEVVPKIWNLTEGNRLFDQRFSRLQDLRQGPRGMAFQRSGGTCGDPVLFLEPIEPYSDCEFGSEEEGRAARGQPLPSGQERNIHPNPSVEENLSFVGKGIRAVLERSSDWAVAGDHSVKVAVTEDSSSHRGPQAGLPHATNATPSTEYAISAMVKSSSCGWLSIASREFDREGNLVSYNTSPSTVVSEQPTWLGLTFTSTPLTFSFSFEVRTAIQAPMEKGFVYYYDNLQVWATGE